MTSDLKNWAVADILKSYLERIRDIRASEKVFYRQVLEIYATCIDYNPTADESVKFFKKVQNKFQQEKNYLMGMAAYLICKPWIRQKRSIKNISRRL